MKTTTLIKSKMFIERDGRETLVTITSDFYRGNRRDVDDPDEVTDVTAKDENGNAVELTEAEEEQAEAKMLEGAR